jgi:alanine racemase
MGDPDSLEGVTRGDRMTVPTPSPGNADALPGASGRGGPAEPRRSAPVARIDLRALRANVESLLLRTDGAFSVADLRRDAWGHGLVPVAGALHDLGVDAMIVDTDDVDRLGAEFPGTAVGGTGTPTLDPDEMYGLPGSTGAPVMRLTGTVLLTKALRAGEGVSYGHTHRASADTHVALVTGGYAQGVVRGLGDHISIGIRGMLHPVVGRVAMDVCVIDIGDAAVARGDEAVFFGGERDDPSLGEWVAHSGLTAGELVTAIGLRVQRRRAG